MGAAHARQLRRCRQRHAGAAAERVYTEELPRRFVDEHLSIFDALCDGDTARAHKQLKLHLEHGRATILTALKS